MSNIIPQLLPIEFNSERRRHEVLTNIVKMLTNRKLLKKENLEDNIKKILSIDSDDNLYKIQLDNPEIYYPVNEHTKNFYVKLLNQKVTGVSKSSNVGEFLFKYKNNPKIIVASSVTSKAIQQLNEDFPHSEIFLEKELMMDLVSHVSVPKHELLDENDTKLVLEEYFTKKREMPKIFITDPVSKYYNAKIGQIFRIIRPSETSGMTFYYRLVIRGSITADK